MKCQKPKFWKRESVSILQNCLFFKYFLKFFSNKIFSAPEIPGEIEAVDVGTRTAILDWQREHRGYLDGFYLEMNPPDGGKILI